VPKYKLEYLTFPLESLHPPNDTALAKKWRPPVPRHLLPRSLHNVSRTRSRYAPYRMKDLTIPRWITLARKLAKRERLWNKFVGFMYMGEDQDAALAWM
jgi:endopolyphosphatase